MVDVLLVRIVHLVFAGVWAGAVVFAALVVVPLARDGAFAASRPIRRLSSRLVWISRLSAVVLLLTGGHLAAADYTAESLTGTLEGQLVLVMTGLWVVLIGLVEAGTSRLDRGLEAGRRREPAAAVEPLFWAAAGVAVGLLVVAGLLTGGVGAHI